MLLCAGFMVRALKVRRFLWPQLVSRFLSEYKLQGVFEASRFRHFMEANGVCLRPQSVLRTNHAVILLSGSANYSA